MTIKEKIAILQELSDIMDSLYGQIEYMEESTSVYTDKDIAPKKKVLSMLEDMAKKV